MGGRQKMGGGCDIEWCFFDDLSFLRVGVGVRDRVYRSSSSNDDRSLVSERTAKRVSKETDGCRRGPSTRIVSNWCRLVERAEGRRTFGRGG